MSKKLKKLFIMMTAVLAVTGVSYVIGHNTQTVYASQINEQNEEGKVDIGVTYTNENSRDSINPMITITNKYNKELNLEDLKLRYYYPCSGESDEVFECYYAGTVDGDYKDLTDSVEGTIEESEDGRYLEITFNGGSLEKGQSISINANIHKKDWTKYDAIDKSLCKINAYVDGKLVYGDEDTDTDLQMPVIDKNEYLIRKSNEEISIKINENGNKFLGVEGYKEGTDYTFKDGIITLKSNLIDKFAYEECKDFYLNFENNIRKVVTAYYMKSVIPEYFTVDIKEAQGNRGDLVEVPVSISHNVHDILTQCDFNLKYDTDMFSDAYIECDNYTGKLNWETDKENGIVHVTYDKCDDTFNGTYIPDYEVEQPQLAMNLVLKVKENSLIGDTRIIFESNEFIARNQINYSAYCEDRGWVVINK